MRLDKYLAHAGFGTRTEVKQLIKKGSVSINGKTVKKPETKVNDVEKVTVDGHAVQYEKYIYIMLHKPAGVISATEDVRHETVIDLVPEYRHYALHPVGRLDRDTEGLLILTNDGQFSHEVLSPKKHVNKTYYAQIDGRVTENEIELFSRGVTLDDGYKTMPAHLTILNSNDQSEIELTIQEGKFHQVKRMFEAVGMSVTYLKRIQMGELRLDSELSKGKYRLLTDKEINLVKIRK